MTTPPSASKEEDNTAASDNVEKLLQAENIHENEVEGERIDSQPVVNTDQVEPVADPGTLHIKDVQEEVHDDHHAVHNPDQNPPGLDQALSHGHQKQTDHHGHSHGHA